MVVLAITLSLLVMAYHAFTAWQRYQNAQALIISLALVALGELNCLAGLLVSFADTGYSPFVLGLGLLSMGLGSFLDEYAYKDAVDAVPYAIQSGIFVFVVGLLLFIEQA